MAAATLTADKIVLEDIPQVRGIATECAGSAVAFRFISMNAKGKGRQAGVMLSDALFCMMAGHPESQCNPDKGPA